MPKPIAGAFGSGMHTHLSLFEGDVNAFTTRATSTGCRRSGRRFIAGLLRHAREITAVTNQWVNSYKRLAAHRRVRGARLRVLGRNNRSALVRVPLPKKGKECSTRIEYRSPDPACNPYLAFSVMLAAGLKGIEEGYELPPEATNNIFEMTDEERAAEGIGALPHSLAEAVDVMERSELVAEALGEHVFEYFIRNKRTEWADYKAQVTPWELDRYLGIAVAVRRLSTWTAAGVPRSAAADAGADARPRRATRGRPSQRLGRRAARAAPTVGPARSCAPTRTRGRVRHLPGAAQARRPLEPILLLVARRQLGELELREDLFDDFCLSPFHPTELEAGCATSTGAPAGARGRRSSSTASSCSTSRRTRPRWPHRRSTSRTWSTSC